MTLTITQKAKIKKQTVEDEKAIECINYLKNYCNKLCESCFLHNTYSCPCEKGDRCPSMWDI